LSAKLLSSIIESAAENAVKLEGSMDAATATVLSRATGPAIAVLVKELTRILGLAARASQLEQRVVLYLRVAQDCVDGL